MGSIRFFIASIFVGVAFPLFVLTGISTLAIVMSSVNHEFGFVATILSFLILPLTVIGMSIYMPIHSGDYSILFNASIGFGMSMLFIWIAGLLKDDVFDEIGKNKFYFYVSYASGALFVIWQVYAYFFKK